MNGPNAQMLQRGMQVGITHILLKPKMHAWEVIPPPPQKNPG